MRSQSGKSSVRAAFCRMCGKSEVNMLQVGMRVIFFYGSDLQCVGQTAAGVAGVTHSVQSLAGKF